MGKKGRDAMSRPQTKVPANKVRSIVSRYTKKGEGLAAIAKAVGFGIQVVRRILVENDVKISTRGRPRTS